VKLYLLILTLCATAFAISAHAGSAEELQGTYDLLQAKLPPAQPVSTVANLWEDSGYPLGNLHLFSSDIRHIADREANWVYIINPVSLSGLTPIFSAR
jgi:hypothetical protein